MPVIDKVLIVKSIKKGQRQVKTSHVCLFINVKMKKSHFFYGVYYILYHLQEGNSSLLPKSLWNGHCSIKRVLGLCRINKFQEACVNLQTLALG